MKFYSVKKEDDVQYRESNELLPRWAYTEQEWKTEILKIAKEKYESVRNSKNK